MTGADIVIGGLRNGEAYLEDRYATANQMPELDPTQNWNLISGSQVDGYTILKFDRVHKTCDSRDVDISHETAKLIWAYSSATSLQYHGSTNRGHKSLLLLEPEVGTGITMPADVVTYDFLINNHTLPAKDTEYYCKAFRIPAGISSKQHMIRADPMITAGNEQNVHHILLQACLHDVNDTHHDSEYVCNEWETSTGTSSGLNRCLTLTMAWAIGGPSYYFPSNVGLAIGDGTFKFIVMQMHYDNPSLRADIVDSSGLQIFVTPTLRSLEAGILEVGLMPTPSHIIPPGQDKFKTEAWCPHQCFEGQTNTHPEGITVFGLVLHTHLLGVGVKLRHFRNGVELEPIAVDNNYDFDFQTFSALPSTVKIQPTDDLMVECDYRSTGRSNITLGGEGTREEMCMVFVAYYPAYPFSLCLSTPTDATVKNALINYQTNPSASSSDLVANMDWTQQTNVDYFQSRINQGSVYYTCQTNFDQTDTPVISQAYTTMDSCTAGATGLQAMSSLMTLLLVTMVAAWRMM